MDTSIFTDPSKEPSDRDLEEALSDLFSIWLQLKNYVTEKYPTALEQWNYSGVKYGWSFRIKDRKRAIMYFLPRKDFFKVAFVFGQKATDKILISNIADEIKSELSAAKVYAEGRGIRIDIHNNSIVNDIKKLIDIKLAH